MAQAFCADDDVASIRRDAPLLRPMPPMVLAQLPCVGARGASRAAPPPPPPAAAAVAPLATLRRAAAAAAAAATLLSASPALADLNRFEGATFGEFNRGSAQQFGGTHTFLHSRISRKMHAQPRSGRADAHRRPHFTSCHAGTNQKNVDFVKEYGKDLRLSNFTATDMRNAKLAGADLRGAYLIKAVAPGADFRGANLTDALMDRAVFVGADFTDAILARVVLTLSDMNGANVTNADFTDALLDKLQQQALCKTAAGTNAATGADTRKSLGCGGRPRGSPSAYMTDDKSVKPEALFEESRFSSYANQ